VSRSELDLIDHTLRGSLNVALLNLQLLSASAGVEPGERELVDKVRAELRLLADALLPSALEILGLEITTRSPVNLGDVVQEALASQGVVGVVVAPGPWPVVPADPALLGLAVAHLARNALAVTTGDTRPPEIGWEQGEAGVELLVRDWAGAGVRSFAPGTYPTRRGHIGGVSVALRVARLHGGALAYERRGDALVARLTLPAASGGDGVREGQHGITRENVRQR
jgi:hypothetical protein